MTENNNRNWQRESKFIIIRGVKSHNVTEDQYEGNVAVLVCSLRRKYTTAIERTECFATLRYNFELNSRSPHVKNGLHYQRLYRISHDKLVTEVYARRIR